MTGPRRPRSLRGRLVALMLLMLAVVGLLVGVTTTAALRTFLIGQLDVSLTGAQGRVIAGFGPNGPNPDDQNSSPAAGSTNVDIRGQEVGTLTARIVGGHVMFVRMVEGLQDVDVVATTADEAALTAVAPGAPPTSSSLSIGKYRLVAGRGPDGDVWVTGLPLDTIDQTVGRLMLLEALAFAGALILVGLIATGAIGASLRPLRRVTATAGAVAELPLESGEVDLPYRVDEGDGTEEVRRLATAFNRMLGHVEGALEQRHASEDQLRRFVADASHELRTPLAGIRGYAELLGRRPEPLPDDVVTAVRRIDGESQRMSRLVDDLLLLARLDAAAGTDGGRPLAADTVDLVRVAADAAMDAAVVGDDHRWNLVLPDEAIDVLGDNHRLHQVVANLMANARLHTPGGTTVTVSVDRQSSDWARVIVADDGPGIPADVQARIFDRFVRGDASRATTVGSSGLGLAIVKAVVDAHGGHVSVLSPPPGQDQGTQFTVLLPSV
jgi:two-component system, OmpR family, sensor kinase